MNFDCVAFLMVDVTCKIDTTNLNRGLAIMQRGYTHRIPAIAVNTAALVVARFTWANMPVVAQETIDADMQIETSPTVLNSGELSKNKKKQHKVMTSLVPRTAAMMIVVARMHAGSKYSALTGNYWPVIPPGSFGRAYGSENAKQLFWEWVEKRAERMVRARHSSANFLQSCWIPAIRALEPFADPSVAGRGGASIGPGRREKFAEDSGYAKPAQAGQIRAICEIGNSAGTAGINSVLYTKHNNALWRVTPPVLQKAINDETEHTIERLAKKGFDEDKAKMLIYGFK